MGGKSNFSKVWTVADTPPIDTYACVRLRGQTVQPDNRPKLSTDRRNHPESLTPTTARLERLPSGLVLHLDDARVHLTDALAQALAQALTEATR